MLTVPALCVADARSVDDRETGAGASEVAEPGPSHPGRLVGVAYDTMPHPERWKALTDVTVIVSTHARLHTKEPAIRLLKSGCKSLAQFHSCFEKQAIIKYFAFQFCYQI